MCGRECVWRGSVGVWANGWCENVIKVLGFLSIKKIFIGSVLGLECHGGIGYIEESIMPRLYREVPLNSIWEGPGNVMALDVLRAITKDALAGQVLIKEIKSAYGADDRLDRLCDRLESLLESKNTLEVSMREITQMMALGLQGALLIKYSSKEVAEAFCASRLNNQYGGAFGTLPAETDFDSIIERAYSL